MSKAKPIEHMGIIQSIKESIIKVAFIQESSCSTCSAKGICSVPGKDDEIVEVIDFSGKYSIGEEVNIILEESLGLRALFLGYLIPFLIVFVILAIASYTLHDDLKAGLISLFSLVPYYFILYLNRGNLKKTFSFKIRKLV